MIIRMILISVNIRIQHAPSAREMFRGQRARATGDSNAREQVGAQCQDLCFGERVRLEDPLTLSLTQESRRHHFTTSRKAPGTVRLRFASPRSPAFACDDENRDRDTGWGPPRIKHPPSLAILPPVNAHPWLTARLEA